MTNDAAKYLCNVSLLKPRLNGDAAHGALAAR